MSWPSSHSPGFGVAEADLRGRRFAVVHLRVVAAAGGGEEPLLRELQLVDRREIHPLRLDPDAHLHARARGRSRRGPEARAGSVRDREPSSRGRSRSPTRRRGRVPPRVDHEELDARARRVAHLVADRFFIDPGAVGEPRVVGDGRLERAPVPDALPEVPLERQRDVRLIPARHAEEAVRAFERLVSQHGRRRVAEAELDRHQPIAGGPGRLELPGAGPVDAAEETAGRAREPHHGHRRLRRPRRRPQFELAA